MNPTKGSIPRWLLLVTMLSASAAPAQVQTVPAPTRGELLYTTHCIACHSAKMHWRDQKQATDWVSLKAQVRRWQAADRLGWSEADVTEVARHLNETIYHYPHAADRVSRVDRSN